MESNSQSDVRASLDSVAVARTAAADRLITPWWYYPVLGLLVAQHAFVQGLDDQNWTLPSAVLLLGGAYALVIAYRRLTGLSVAGPQGARSRALFVLMSLVAAGCILASAVAEREWVALLAAAVVFVATSVLGHSYDDSRRHELRDPVAVAA